MSPAERRVVAELVGRRSKTRWTQPTRSTGKPWPRHDAEAADPGRRGCHCGPVGLVGYPFAVGPVVIAASRFRRVLLGGEAVSGRGQSVFGTGAGRGSAAGSQPARV